MNTDVERLTEIHHSTGHCPTERRSPKPLDQVCPTNESGVNSSAADYGRERGKSLAAAKPAASFPSAAHPTDLLDRAAEKVLRELTDGTVTPECR